MKGEPVGDTALDFQQQRSAPPGASREIARRRLSGERRNMLYSPGSPSSPTSFPARSSQLKRLEVLEEPYNSTPLVETATLAPLMMAILATGSASGWTSPASRSEATSSSCATNVPPRIHSR